MIFMNRARGGWDFLNYLNPPMLGFTWTPASGCNIFDCAVRQRNVCWAEKIVKRLVHICPLCPTFEPHLHDGTRGTPNRLEEPLKRKKPSVIAPVPTGDFCGLPIDMRERILNIIEEADWHIFPILTKAPHGRYIKVYYPDNVWFGVTVNEQNDIWRLEELKLIEALHKWAIFEPLYSEIEYELAWLDWIIIGPQSRPELQPENRWVQNILDNAPGVPIFMKSSLSFHPKKREGPYSRAIVEDKSPFFLF